MAASLALACPALMLAFSRWGGALFPGYRLLSKAWLRALSAVTGVVPLALWDLGALALAVVALVTLVRRVRRREPLLPWLSAVTLALAATLLSFVGGWALNHYAPPLAADLDLAVEGCSVDELARATGAYLEDAALLAADVPREGDGALAEQDFLELARIAGAAYEPLGEEYAVFGGGSTARVKALLLWGVPLLYSGYTGMFWAPTAEAGVPLDCARAELPFTMCHEAAHRLGLASEEEANFAAYLACSSSTDVRLRYAGAYEAFVSCYGALHGASPERAEQVLREVASQEGLYEGVALVLGDWQAARTHYDRYESAFEKVGDAVNDRYLKGFGEESGIRSYGLVVDYLVAWHNLGS